MSAITFIIHYYSLLLFIITIYFFTTVFLLGINICKPHKCNCGTMVTSQGSHGLACRLSSGRMSRHQQLNDIVCHALNSAQIPVCKEPSGLTRSDGKRPDTLVSRQSTHMGRNSGRQVSSLIYSIDLLYRRWRC